MTVATQIERLPVPAVPGVYWFICKNEILYVGESTNLRRRISGHRLAPLLKHEECVVEWRETADHKLVERDLIRHLRPYLNGQPWYKTFAVLRAAGGPPVDELPLPECLR